ncbi:MAG: adenylate/guanylate cyclase domain-containing protein [Spirochaetes bacterium]|nr:adenylate/guanylate cyclase domain-containing protein [Spirochaetota bacterium]
MVKKRIQTAGRAGVLLACFALIALFSRTALHGYLENKVFDSFFHFRDSLAASPAGASPITIVGIDRKTLGAYKAPVIFWDREFADTIRTIASARPRAIGFDILHLAQTDTDRYKAKKDRLKEVLLRTGNLVLPYSSETGDIPIYIARHLEELLGLGDDMSPGDRIRMLPVAEKTTGVSFGFVELSEDDDGIIRRAVLADGGDGTRASFPLKIFMRYHGITDEKVILKDGRLQAGNRAIPLDQGALIINYAGPPETFRAVPMIDVNRKKNDPTFLARHFRDRVVLIGVWDRMLMDIHNTPYVSSLNRSSRTMYGVEIIANILDTMLRQRYIRKSGTAIAMALCFLFALGGIMLTRLSTARGIAVVAASEAAYLAAAFGLFAVCRYELSILPPLLALPLGFSSGYLFEHYILGRDSILLKSVLGSYLDPRVVERVVKSGDTGILKGQRREITVLFSDIRNFTALSERMSRPEDVVDILNVYLPEMCGLILASEGCVDKFIGDGIMAFWNAPNDVERHAEKAVRCAMAMQERMAAVNEKLRMKGLVNEGLRIGIGIHTGSAVVGNIGGEAKNDYTAIGDTVNLASRLEGKTKDYECNIIISAAVRNEIRDMGLALKPIGKIEVKGKKNKVQVYGIKD